MFFAADVDLPGYQVNTFNGLILPMNDHSSGQYYSVDYFYCNLMSDLVLPDEIPVNNAYEIKYQVAETDNFVASNPPSYSMLFGGDEDNVIEVKRNSTISTWQVGQTFIGYEQATMLAGQRHYFLSTLTLSDISTTAPGTPSESVPEPGMFGLFAMGLLSIGGIGVIRRRK